MILNGLAAYPDLLPGDRGTGLGRGKTVMKDPRERLENLRPVRGRLDYRLFEYGPILMLAQFNITGFSIILLGLYNKFSPNPQMIPWAVISPIYVGVLVALFAASLALRNFLCKILAMAAIFDSSLAGSKWTDCLRRTYRLRQHPGFCEDLSWVVFVLSLIAFFLPLLNAHGRHRAALGESGFDEHWFGGGSHDDQDQTG